MTYYATKDIEHEDGEYYIPENAEVKQFSSFKDVESFLFNGLPRPEPHYKWAISDELYQKGNDELIHAVIQVPVPVLDKLLEGEG